MGFGQLGVVLCELFQGGLGGSAFTGTDLDLAEQQTHLRIVGVGLQVSLHCLLCLWPLQVAHHALHIGVRVGMGWGVQPKGQQICQRNCQHGAPPLHRRKENSHRQAIDPEGLGQGYTETHCTE